MFFIYKSLKLFLVSLIFILFQSIDHNWSFGQKCMVCAKDATSACRNCCKVFFCSDECGVSLLNICSKNMLMKFIMIWSDMANNKDTIYWEISYSLQWVVEYFLIAPIEKIKFTDISNKVVFRRIAS